MPIPSSAHHDFQDVRVLSADLPSETFLLETSPLPFLAKEKEELSRVRPPSESHISLKPQEIPSISSTERVTSLSYPFGFP